jgi:hypothetical protein
VCAADTFMTVGSSGVALPSAEQLSGGVQIW